MSVESVNKELQQIARQYRVDFRGIESNDWMTNDAMSFATKEEAEQYGKEITQAQITLYDIYRVVEKPSS